MKNAYWTNYSVNQTGTVTKKTTRTVRKFDKDGNLVKETVVEEVRTESLPYYTVTNSATGTNSTLTLIKEKDDPDDENTVNA